MTSFASLDLSKRYTFADYLTWQFQERLELIKGQVFKMTPAPITRHQDVSGELYLQLGSQIKQHRPCKVYYAPFDVRLPLNGATGDKVDTVVQPDLCIVCDPAKIDVRGCNGGPDMVVEILLPSTTKHDLKTKYALYEEAGVMEYWVVNPVTPYVQVYVLDANSTYQLKGNFVETDTVPLQIMPEITVDLSEVFPPLPPEEPMEGRRI